MKYTLLLCVLFVAGLASLTPVASAQFSAPVELSGFAWSSNIGWISFNCSNTGTCGTYDYGVEIDNTLTAGYYELNGYAWSSNIGWISFEETSGCPGGNCKARINASTNEVEGWARACSATINGDCTGPLHPDTAGFDGWISLNCANTGGCGSVDYNVSANNGSLVGYAWGGAAGAAGGAQPIGWIRFDVGSSPVVYTPPCDPSDVQCTGDLSGRDIPNQWCEYGVNIVSCPAGLQCDPISGMCNAPSSVTGLISVSPAVARQGATVTINWSTSAVSPATCTVYQSNPGGQISGVSSWTGLTGSQTSDPINNLTVVRLYCSPDGVLPEIEVASTTVNIIPRLIET